jgi:hypothetical protein
VIPDTQVKPGVNTSHLGWIGNYIAEKRPDVIVQIGDFADMPSLSSYDKGKRAAENQRYQKDIDSARAAMAKLVAPFKKIKDYKPRMVLTLGNHEERIIRATDDNPVLFGKLGVADLGYEEHGWEVHDFLKPVVIDGIAYAHYFVTGAYGRPVTSAKALVKRMHQSATMGHVQKTDIDMGDTKADGTPVIGLFCGTCYLHDENYLGPQGNSHRRQIVVKHEVRHGAYDPMFVSLDYLKREYS